MSGINEIKKKTKLSIDEMYDNQLDGKLDNQKERKSEIQETIHPAIQEAIQPLDHTAGQTSTQQPGKLETHLDYKYDAQTTRPTSVFSTKKQQTQQIPTYKMTFSLTEDIYKAFNDLYANRMLQGRKTEKSEMICEAIQWLIKMEEEQSK